MTVMNCIENYVNTIDARMPIFATEIQNCVKKQLGNVKNDIINEYVNRYAKRHPEFERYRKGIYFKSVATPFGRAGINFSALVAKVYLTDGCEIFGYETGPSYMNKIGLTTQVPNCTYIATERARITLKTNQELRLIKPVIKVTKNNYRYLQMLDILENRYNVEFEADNYKDILQKEMRLLNLNFETLAAYAKYYNSDGVNRKLVELAREVTV